MQYRQAVQLFTITVHIDPSTSSGLQVLAE